MPILPTRNTYDRRESLLAILLAPYAAGQPPRPRKGIMDSSKWTIDIAPRGRDSNQLLPEEYYFVALFFEGPFEIKPDNGFAFGIHHTKGHSPSFR